MAASEAILRYPQDLPLHATLSQEQAVTMLLQAPEHAARYPFVYDYIDRPQDGFTTLLYIVNAPLPVDGIRWQDTEATWMVPFGNRKLEIVEQKFGFVPGGKEVGASRVRRRFRLVEGGVQQLAILHYSRGQSVTIIPSLHSQPVRTYPLPSLAHTGAVYVYGEKRGQKTFLPGSAHGGHAAQGHHHPGAPMTQRAMMERRNAEAAERARMAERAAASRAQQGAIEEDVSDDESEQTSTRALALARYRRNHEMMHDVFMYAAFGDTMAPPPPRPSVKFKKDDLEAKVEKLRAEVEELQARDAERREARRRAADAADSFGVGAGDVSMDSVSGSMFPGSTSATAVVG